ncbi:MAG: tetratricopeptide repeat protein [Patescibacteria group bacterium]
MQIKISNKKKFIFFLALIAFFTSSLGYYFYLKKDNRKKEKVAVEGVEDLGKEGFDKAAEKFEKALKEDKSPHNLKMLAISRYNQGDHKEAEKHFKELLKKDKENAYEYYNSLGNIYRDKGELEEALEYYEKAIKEKNDYEQAYQNLIILCLYEKKPPQIDKAHEFIKKGIENIPKSKNIKNFEKIVEEKSEAND